MFSALRRRIHVSPATTISSLALVFAMTGGAYAAGRYVITSTRQIKPSVLKQLQGKAGANGASGAQGASGPAGSQGPAGANGKDGTPGTNGQNGVSVTSAVLAAKNANCPNGGSEFTAAEGKKTYACNGEKGKEGTFGGQMLPEGKTLTGAYSAAAFSEASATKGGGKASTAVSFALPVPGGTILVHEIKAGETTLPEGCTGNANEPGAEPGNLCVFSRSEENVLAVGISPQGGATEIFGVEFYGLAAAKGNVYISGTWAVTAGSGVGKG